MESLNFTLISSPKHPHLGLCSVKDASKDVFRRRPFLFGWTIVAPPYSKYCVSALSRSHVVRFAAKPQQNPKSVQEKLKVGHFASIYSSSGQETSSVGFNPQLSVPPPSSAIGSPLFWIGIGVGLSALFSWVATRLKRLSFNILSEICNARSFQYHDGQMNSQSNQFKNASFSPGSSYPFPMSPASGPAAPATSTGAFQSQASSASAMSQSAGTNDIPATKVRAAPATDVKGETEVNKESKKIAFVDVSPEETDQRSPFESFKDVNEASPTKEAKVPEEVSQNGATSNHGFSYSPGSQSARKSILSVEALEKMMEDPTVQRNNMSGSSEWDSQMMDTLKNFDLSSPEVKQQFDQIGLTPGGVISKIMANPEVAMAFQNPKVEAPIMDCSQNPMNIIKYQNDQEVMSVFNKLSELFPTVTS